MGKLINRIRGSSLLISSLQGYLALRTNVGSLGKPRNSTSLSRELDIKRHTPIILYILLMMCHNVNRQFI